MLWQQLAAKIFKDGELSNQATKDFLPNLVGDLFMWLGGLAFAMIVFGGIKYMLAAGEVEKIKKAKKIIAYSIIGMVIAASSSVIIKLIAGVIG